MALRSDIIGKRALAARFGHRVASAVCQAEAYSQVRPVVHGVVFLNDWLTEDPQIRAKRLRHVGSHEARIAKT